MEYPSGIVVLKECIVRLGLGTCEELDLNVFKCDQMDINTMCVDMIMGRDCS